MLHSVSTDIASLSEIFAALLGRDGHVAMADTPGSSGPDETLCSLALLLICA